MARQRSDRGGGGGVVHLAETPASKRRREKEQARRTEALTLLLTGLTYDQVAAQMGVSKANVEQMVGRALGRAAGHRDIERLRAIENARLDRVQESIWGQVLAGDLKAVDVFLRLSARRARMNGLDAPTRIALSVSVRQEMETALAALEQVVLGEVVADADE